MIKPLNGGRWYCCDYCGKALFPVRPDTIIKNLVYRCKACKHDLKINI